MDSEKILQKLELMDLKDLQKNPVELCRAEGEEQEQGEGKGKLSLSDSEFTEDVGNRRGVRRQRAKRADRVIDDEELHVFKVIEEEEYAKVVRVIGEDKYQAMCFNATKQLCRFRCRKKELAVGDIIIIWPNEFKQEVARFLWRFSPRVVRFLIYVGELPENAQSDDADMGQT